MKKTIVLLGILALIFILSCKHEPLLVPTQPKTDTTKHTVDTTHKDTTHIDTTKKTGGCSPDTVYFSNTILPLIISSCASKGCHDAATHKEGYTLTSYSGIMRLVSPGNPSSSRLYTQMNGSKKIMPPSGKLPAAELAEIYKWIQQGAKNNKCTEATCDSLNVTFSGSVAPILNTYCIGCHKSSLASGNITLDSYTGASTVAKNGQLMGGLTGNLIRMPQTGGSLSTCDLGIIRKWVADGAPNN
jgi:hypothetical protein